MEEVLTEKIEMNEEIVVDEPATLVLPVDVYCLTYKNEVRKKQMLEKFSKLRWQVNMHESVGPEDPRILLYELSSCMLGHMDMIAKFYRESTKEFAIFCEDDICIHEKLAEMLPSIIEDSKKNNIHLILLGYLMNYHINYPGMYGHYLIAQLSSNPAHGFYTFNEELWGTQMYMISKTYAKELLENYGMNYVIRWKNDPEKYTCYCADWIITKKTDRRALMYPPYCIENGNVEHQIHYGQREYHRQSYEKHVNEHFI